MLISYSLGDLLFTVRSGNTVQQWILSLILLQSLSSPVPKILTSTVPLLAFGVVSLNAVSVCVIKRHLLIFPGRMNECHPGLSLFLSVFCFDSSFCSLVFFFPLSSIPACLCALMNMHVKALFALFATGREEHTKGKDSSVSVCV